MAEIEKTTKTAPVAREADSGDWFDRWFADWPRPGFWPGLRRSFGEGMDPLRVEEFTEGDQMVVRAEMPGIDPDKDVKATYRDGILEVRIPIDRKQAEATRRSRSSERETTARGEWTEHA